MSKKTLRPIYPRLRRHRQVRRDDRAVRPHETFMSLATVIRNQTSFPTIFLKKQVSGERRVKYDEISFQHEYSMML
jgi:hypothetical protein